MLILGKNVYIIIDNISVFRKRSYLKDVPDILKLYMLYLSLQ